MAAVPAASRSLGRLLSAVAADYGAVDLLRERREVDPREYDRLLERARGQGPVGGAGAWVRPVEGGTVLSGDAVLLVRYPEGWAEPGAPLRPAEEPEDCARRAVEHRTGLDATLTGLSHVHVRYATVPGRDAIPQPMVVFDARATGDPEPGPEVRDAAWHEELPDAVLYEAIEAIPGADD
jgi:ADP-ribose pyrophosphatase YjhB (NUDIX family)